MRIRETVSTVLSSLTAVVLDAFCVYGGFLLALWIRFDSGLFELREGFTKPAFDHLLLLSGVGTLVFLATFHLNGLYKRPHHGRFEDKIPRLVKCILISFLVYLAIETALRLDPPFSRLSLLLSFGTITVLLLLQKYLVYRIEWNLARHMPKINRVLVIGTDATAVQVNRAINNEPFLRAEVAGYVRSSVRGPGSTTERHAEIGEARVLGELAEIATLLERHKANQIILCDHAVTSERKIDLANLCEDRFVHFSAVPDMFTSLAGQVEIVNLGGVPLIGLQKWPLDYIHHRLLKRAVDILGALFGLLLFSPVIGLAALRIKRGSSGPVFYKQIRCGKNGREFTIYKLRTMREDSEVAGPGWTTSDDPRMTPEGKWLRRFEIDELPQLYNVLLGQMSLVGPRPERPVYVKQFKGEIDRYMQRHVSLPGMTGWAQVNGLRGDTSISDRISFDLYYLENWSLSFDFKILIKTLFTTARPVIGTNR